MSAHIRSTVRILAGFALLLPSAFLAANLNMLLLAGACQFIWRTMPLRNLQSLWGIMLVLACAGCLGTIVVSLRWFRGQLPWPQACVLLGALGGVTLANGVLLVSAALYLLE